MISKMHQTINFFTQTPPLVKQDVSVLRHDPRWINHGHVIVIKPPPLVINGASTIGGVMAAAHVAVVIAAANEVVGGVVAGGRGRAARV